MKPCFQLLSIVGLFCSLFGCEKNTTDIASNSDTYTKQITAFDASGQFSIKLRLTATNSNLLQSYDDQSFVLSFTSPTLDSPESAVSDNTAALPEVNANALTIEPVETSVPHDTPFLLTLNKTNASNQAARLATRMVTVTLLGTAPNTYIYVYNQSSASMSVVFGYTTDPKLSSWVNAATKTLAARKDASYCRLGIKGIRAAVTYDANSGTYSYFVYQKYSCP